MGRTDCIQKELWRRAHWITAPAAEGVHARRNGQVEAGRGGVALGFNLDLRNYITKEGSLPGGGLSGLAWTTRRGADWVWWGFTAQTKAKAASIYGLH